MEAMSDSAMVWEVGVYGLDIPVCEGGQEVKTSESDISRRLSRVRLVVNIV